MKKYYCPHCGSESEPFFSRIEPMGFYCQDCGKDVDDETAMSDTPRTDFAYKNHPWDGHDSIPLEFARQLERELAAVTEERDRLLEEQRLTGTPIQ